MSLFVHRKKPTVFIGAISSGESSFNEIVSSMKVKSNGDNDSGNVVATEFS